MFQKIILALVRGGNGKILVLIIAIALCFFIFKKFSSNEQAVVSHDVLVEKIEAMGKVELAKFSIKDVIEKKTIKEWWPDSKVLMIAVGEAVGCIDLSKVKPSDVKKSGDSILITLPKPEICYVKISHEKSKVYDISGVYFKEDTKALVEDVYKIAEKELTKEVLEMGILDETRKNAYKMLKPVFENISGKRVGIVIRQRAN
jgi:ABC-type antimicrobial peptide transport system permease subunit